MNLSDLQNMGGFVDAKPVEKEVKWKGLDGTENTGKVFVVRQPFGVIEAALIGPDKERSQGAMLISKCLRFGSDASEQMTYEQAYSLSPPVAWAFVAAINEVNAPKR